MAKKMRSTVIIQKTTEMSTEKKFLWMLIILLVIIAIIGTSIDMTGESTRQRTLPTKERILQPEIISYEQLQEMLTPQGVITLHRGTITPAGTFVTTRTTNYQAENTQAYQQLQTIITQQENAGRTFQIIIQGTIYRVMP
ncbi:MAG TPA: hypothetical protein VJB87_05700 [Candidatus Nanoarchaeia archaeon]|nr:hypothetical protein [Candidatus Nanoarchaeia archaeon]